jgi:site-specific DNA-methyltransferase (adenine-specific)
MAVQQHLLLDSKPNIPTAGRYEIFHTDAFQWLKVAPASSIQAVVTDPPYGLIEYSETEQLKLRRGKGGNMEDTAVF